MERQNQPEFAEIFETEKTFDEIVDVVLAEVPKAKFRVLHVHDVQATLREKGFEHDPYKIIEICNAPNAKRVLEADPLAGLFMPCKINVFVVDGKTQVTYLKPGLLATFFPQSGIESVAEEVESVLRSVVEAAK